MKYAIGVDFGTQSGRAVLVDVSSGREMASAVYDYSNAVIDERLPGQPAPISLPADWALQDPEDYLRTLRRTIPELLAESGVGLEDVIGIGIDFTACTILPVRADGTPLCVLDEFRGDPHAWVKLWKHHAAQREADEINDLAHERDEPWLARYGGRTSSEWFFAKTLQLVRDAPNVYDSAARIIEAGDWVVWQLTGQERRSACAAGYKALWSKGSGYVRAEFLAALDPRLESVVDEKMSRELWDVGAFAGGLSADGAALTGLLPGTPVAVANVDAHVSVLACGVTSPGSMVAVMGTSICHVVLAANETNVEGMCGVVEDGVVPGYYAYEAGQPAVGDMLSWFVANAAPPTTHDQARVASSTVHAVLEEEAAHLAPGESGLLALDWWNGNRSVLVDANLSGLIVGMTLATRPRDIYRAMIESAAFGTRAIVDAFRTAGVAVDEIVACGGLPSRNRLLMQVFADVTGMRLSIADSDQAAALGSAITATVAAGPDRGGYATLSAAVAAMAHRAAVRYEPVPGRRSAYDALYSEYCRLHDAFGRGAFDTMARLRDLRVRAMSASGAEE